MKISYQQLTQHLARQLAPIYLVSSDELLLAQEAIETIRQTARKAGFTERVCVTVENTDWGALLYANTHDLSLLATKRIVEINLSHIKSNAASHKILEDYALSPAADTLLIIQTAKLDKKIEKSCWYQALEKVGIILQIWPITTEQLPYWIMQRAKKINLSLTKHAAETLAVQVEGNLLAAAQEIEKLNLLQTDAILDQQTIENIVTDNAHFDIFNLVDSALSGKSKRCLRILQNLAAEDSEPTLILWALTRELRTLAEIAKQLKQGEKLPKLFEKFRIWEKRQPLVQAFLQRHTQQDCWELLINAAAIDRMIKGAERGNVWDELESWVLKITGNAIISYVPIT